MLYYCDHCSVPFEGERCPFCKKKSTRSLSPDDICFLTEKEQIWSGVLADVLKQNNIPFTQKSVLGAGMALRAGPAFESIRFYVLYKHLAEAKEIVNELFSSASTENTN